MTIKLKKYCTIVILSLLASPVSAQEMRSIDDFIIQNVDSNNGSTEVFIGLRCFSLFSVMKVYTFDNKMYYDSEKFQKAANSALEFAINSQNPKNENYISGQIDIMTKSYIDRFLKSKALTGNFSDDPIINSDMKTCSDIF